MNVVDAAYKTAHAYEGGCDALGMRMDMRPGVLRNKVNPKNDTHHLTLAEADEMMGLTGDHRILQALAAAHGYTLVRTEQPEAAGTLVSSVLAFLGASGRMSESLHDVVAKGQVTKNDSRQIESHGADVQAALIRMVNQATKAAGQRTVSAVPSAQGEGG